MKLPFVSRGTYEAQVYRCHELAALVSRLQAEVHLERERHSGLVETVIELKRDGFNLPPAADQIMPPPDRLPDEVAAALDGLQLPGQLYSEHETWARRRLGQGWTPIAVAHELSQGGAGMTIVEEDETE